MLKRRRIAGLYLGHPKKGSTDEISLYHTLGSVGFVAAVRTAFYAMPNPESPDGTDRLLLRNKTNVDRDAPLGFGYRIADAVATFDDGAQYRTSRIEWTGHDDRRPDDVLALAKEMRAAGAEQSKLVRAKKLIEDELAKGPQRVAHLKARACERGVSEATIERAKAEMGITSERKSGYSWWELPGTETEDEQAGMPF